MLDASQAVARNYPAKPGEISQYSIAGIVAGAHAARVLCGTFVNQADWQSFYNRHGGPLPYAKACGFYFEACGAFVAEFLRLLSEAPVGIYAQPLATEYAGAAQPPSAANAPESAGAAAAGETAREVASCRA